MSLERLTMGMMRPYNSKKYTGDHTNGNFDDPYCEKVARDALTMSTDMLDMFVKKDMLACVGLVMRMKRSSYQDSPWHLVQEATVAAPGLSTSLLSQYYDLEDKPSNDTSRENTSHEFPIAKAILCEFFQHVRCRHCPTTTASQWIIRWNVPSPAFLHNRPTRPVYLKKTRADSVEDAR